MKAKKKSQIDFQIRKNIANSVTILGSTTGSLNSLLSKKYISKCLLKQIIATQIEQIQKIEESKNQILNIIK